MSLSIKSRPLNPIFTLTPISLPGAFIANFFGNAGFSVTLHGRATGDYIYIISNIGDYNGIIEIETIDANSFYIKRNGDYIPYVGNPVSISTIYLYNSTHGWSCVHLPIIYRISNTLWPTNSDDTIRTISTVANSSGYCSLVISGDIKTSGTAAALEFIKITNSGGGGAFPSYDGVYQITSYTNETTFSISLAYDNTVDLSVTNASIQYYYNNYHLKVKINAGLRSGHIAESQKEYDTIATIDIIPDEDNLCVFSLHEILKSAVFLKNNLLLATLPNNIDAFTNFYIEYAEAYDDSDGSVLSVSTPTYTSDILNLEGFAVNAKLPFKNMYSGSMSEYAGTDKKFLTLFESPTIFDGKYFDIGFISQFYQNFANPILSTFLQTASGVSWTLGATPSVVDPQVGAGGSKQLYGEVSRLKSGITYRLAYSVSASGAADVVVGAGAMNASLATGGTFDSDSYTTAGGVTNGTLEFIPGTDPHYIYLVILQSTPTPRTFTLLDYWIYPVNDTSYFNGIILQQGGDTIEVGNYDEGIYRQTLINPTCPATQTTLTLYRKELVTLDTPSQWSNFSAPTAFDSKDFGSLTEAVTTVSVSPAIAYTSLVSVINEIVRGTFIITVSGGATFTTGIRVVVVLADGAGTAISNPATQTITADGTYTLNAALIASNTGARIYVQCFRDGLSAGTATVVITVPETLSVQKTAAISETKTLKIDCECSDQDRYLSWLDPTSGFNYWNFKTKKDRGIDILASGQAKRNLFPTWPQSGGEFADTEEFQTYRVSKKTERIVSQHLTEEEADALSYIKTSPLVQIVNSIYDRRTVIVDTDSFIVLKEIENLRTIEFNITYTDEIPSQTL